MEDVQSYERRNACLQLFRRIPPKSKLGRFLARRLGFERYARVNLDERGTAFWHQIDGRHSLHDIEQHLRSTFDFSLRDSEEATIEFTKKLMLRGLIGLRLADGDLVTRNRNDHGE